MSISLIAYIWIGRCIWLERELMMTCQLQHENDIIWANFLT